MDVMTSLESANASSGELQEMVAQKAGELFAVCDKEGKGFINRLDMQRLHGELPLTDDELLVVFDNLDNDGNGYLTFDEFCQGFGGFCGLNSHGDSSANVGDEVDGSDIYSAGFVNHEPHEDASDTHLRDVISRLVSAHSLEKGNERAILELCHRLRDGDDMSTTVEDFIHLVVHEMTTAKSEKSALERMLKERAMSHEDEVRQLYEEMEKQINEDRTKTVSDEVQRERALSSALQSKLLDKDHQLQEVADRQRSLETQIANLSCGEKEVKSENSQLLQLNQSLMEELELAQRDLESTRVHMATIKHQRESHEESKEAEEEARKLDLEKKSLLKQLDLLRSVNRKLRDDKDEALMGRTMHPHDVTPPAQQTSTPKQLFTRGSNVGKYFPDNSNAVSELMQSAILDESQEDSVGDKVQSGGNCEEDQLSSSTTADSQASSAASGEKRKSTRRKSSRRRKGEMSPAKRANGGNGTADSPDKRRTSPSAHSKRRLEQERKARARFYRKLSKNPHSPAHSSSDEADSKTAVDGLHGVTNEHTVSYEPDRVYKIVFVGNSGVGKTSFIQRFVNCKFSDQISSTIGVDYQVKTVNVNDQSIALQLWDTAGQERYRSITRQYFRKADGVVVMYDVTNEKSFLAVRNWMQSVQEGADPTAVILLLGNKCDIASEKTRQVMPNEGVKLAEEYGAKFSETSAKSGERINDSMSSFACELTKLEDEQRESVLSLAESDELKLRNNACCGGSR